jgi:hypothetical protein
MIRNGLSLILFNALSGCAVYSVADTAVSVTADVVSTGVHVATGVVETAVDAVIPSKSSK